MRLQSHGMETNDPRSIALGQEIRAEAAARGVALTELCKSAGVTRSALYRYLDAERDMPFSILNALADALRVRPFVLIERAEERARRDASSV